MNELLFGRGNSQQILLGTEKKKFVRFVCFLLLLLRVKSVLVCARWIVFDAVVTWIDANFDDLPHVKCGKWLQNSKILAFRGKYVQIGKDFPTKVGRKGNACFVCASVVVTCHSTVGAR